MKKQNLLKLEVENIQAIKAFAMSPEHDAVNVIAGGNKQGKTSLLVAVGMAFVPPKFWPDDPIRHGEEHGFIKVETDDFEVELNLRRDKKPNLKIKRRIDDDEKKTPIRGGERGILNAWINPLAFDVSSFDGDPEVLMKLAGIDFSDLDARHESAYEARRQANVELKTAQTMLDQMQHYPDAPKKMVNVSDLMAEVDSVAKHNETVRAVDHEIANMDGEIADFKNEFSAAERELESMRKEIKEREEEIDSLAKSIDKCLHDKSESQSKRAAMDFKSDEEARAAIESAGETNRQVEANLLRKQQKADVAVSAEHAKDMDDVVKNIAKEREERIKNADMPLPGLGFDEHGQVTYNGSLFSQLSSSEQMVVKLSIGAALNPNLSLVTIDKYESLDSDTRRAVDEWAAENEITVLTTCVGECDGAIVIEAGEVKP